MSLATEMDKVIQRFVDTGMDITFGFTGGEPLIAPHFFDLLKNLLAVPQFKIALDTNLSIDPKKYLKDVPPEKVEYIFASIHIQERLRFNRGVEKFFERAGKLKREGHNIITNYVLYPPTFERFQDDFEFAKKHGIHLAPKPYKGVFEGTRFPDAYTEEQREMFIKLDPACNIRTETVPNYRGLLCNAGKSLIRVDPNGDIVRCKVDRMKLGNIYTGFELFEEVQPCRVNRCPCYGPERLFEGIDQEIPEAV